MTEEMIALNIVIGDRSYRIKSLPKDEEAIRKSLKTINDKIVEFKTQFSGKDMQDYIAMVLIWFATQVPGKIDSDVKENELLEMLSKMDQKISGIL